MNKIQLFNLNQRKTFNPGSKEQMKVVKQYLSKNSWGTGGCPFVLEWPHLTIPDMLKDKITRHALK